MSILNRYKNFLLGSILMLVTMSVSAQPFAFVLFYMSNCPHCQRFDPVLKRYADENHIPVLAYTFNGKSLPSFPNSFTPNQDEVRHFFGNKAPVAPSLFLVNRDTQKIFTLLVGEANINQLNQRVLEVLSQEGVK